MGAVTVDAKRYGRLLARAAPRVIHSEREHARILEEIENLMDRGDSRSPEEDALLELLVSLVNEYEERHFPVREPSPHEVLRYLMEKRGLKQADLVPVLGSSGAVSDAVRGRRAISKTQAKRLAEFFRVSADLFI